MTKEEKIILLAKKYFEDLGYNEKDVKISETYLAITLVLLIEANMPVSYPKYIEVLRCLANIVEINNEKTV